MLAGGCLIAGVFTINLIFLALGFFLYDFEIGAFLLIVKIFAIAFSMNACKKKFNQLPQEMQWAGYRPPGMKP